MGFIRRARIAGRRLYNERSNKTHCVQSAAKIHIVQAAVGAPIATIQAEGILITVLPTATGYCA
jgi:hypothetical protein